MGAFGVRSVALPATGISGKGRLRELLARATGGIKGETQHEHGPTLAAHPHGSRRPTAVAGESRASSRIRERDDALPLRSGRCTRPREDFHTVRQRERGASPWKLSQGRMSATQRHLPRSPPFFQPGLKTGWPYDLADHTMLKSNQTPPWTPNQPVPCRFCTREFVPSRKHKHFCHAECYSAYWRAEHTRLNEHRRWPVPSGTVGAIHELIVATDLLKRGYHVFRAMSPACP